MTGEENSSLSKSVFNNVKRKKTQKTQTHKVHGTDRVRGRTGRLTRQVVLGTRDRHRGTQAARCWRVERGATIRIPWSGSPESSVSAHWPRLTTEPDVVEHVKTVAVVLQQAMVQIARFIKLFQVQHELGA